MEEEKKENIFENAFETEDESEVEPKEKEVKSPVSVATEAPSVEEKKPGLNLDESKVDEADSEKQWYVVNTYAGRERTVADYLEKRKISMNQEKTIFRIVVAQHEEESLDKKTGKPIIMKNGKVKTHIVNFYPGYIFVEAIMTDLAWYIIRNTPGVTGIVGSSGSGTKPFPIPKEDMVPILKSLNMETTENVRTDYKVGEKVLLIEGAFLNEEATIVAIDSEKGRADVSLKFLGRESTVNIPFSSFQKLAQHD